MFNFRNIKLMGFLITLATFCKGQNSPSNDFIISGQGHAGYIISHRNNMTHLIKGHIYGAELNYIFRTDGSKSWHQLYKYPEIGFCLVHMYLANPVELGNLDGAYPYLNFRLNNSKRSWKLNLRMGVGLGYLTKPFDRTTNHKNNAIGSHLNGFVNMRLNWAFRLSNSWRLETGFGLTHASSGAIKTPNLGLNVASANLGIGYVFGNKELQYKKDTMAPEKKWTSMIVAVAGVKELETPGGKKYTAYGIQYNLYRTLNHKNKLGGGIEVAYNNASKEVYESDSIYDYKFSDIIQGGIKVSYSFNVHRLSLPVDFGYYLYKKQSYNGNFFHRVGLRYMVTDHIIANVTLFSHWAKADYFEWGVGYKF